MSFVGGQALYLPIWLTSLEFLRDNGVYYADWVSRAIRNQCVSLLESHYFSNKREFYVFNKQKYKSFEELDRKYPKGKNYQGVIQYSKEITELICLQLRQRVIRKISHEESLDAARIWNPINVVISGKPRLIVHTKINSKYTRPTITLPKIVDSTSQLQDAVGADVHDLKSSYYQLLLDDKSRKVCSFHYEGESYECLCLPFGNSASVIVAQTILGIPAQVIRVRDHRVLFHYIDDYFLRRTRVDQPDILKPELLAHGLVLSDKSQHGTKIEFLGIDLDLTAKDFSLKTETLRKIEKAIADYLILDRGRLLITVEDMETLLGILNFATDCSILHRVNVTHLILSFKIGSKTRNGFCLLDDHCYKEILYWREFCENPVRKPFDRFKPQLVTIEASSDASMKTYAFQDSTGLSGHGTFPPLLISESPDIMGREIFGTRRYLEECDNDINLIQLTDSEPNAHALSKGRSNNLYVNRELNTIYDLIYLKRINFTIVWIPTLEMARIGTDGLSRQDYSSIKDNHGLSETGVSRFEEIYGRPPAVDVFSSIVNNPFNTKYTSKHQAPDDDNYLGMDGLNFVTHPSLITQYCAGGYVYLWPPLTLLPWTVSAVIKEV